MESLKKLKAKVKSVKAPVPVKESSATQTVPSPGTEKKLARYRDIIAQLSGEDEEMPPRVRWDPKSGKVTHLENDTPAGFMLRQMNISGSQYISFASNLVNQLISVSAGTDEPNVDAMNGAIAALAGIGPKDEIEGMLAAQMVATHRLAMEFMARAARGDAIDVVSMNVERATKLTRTFAAQMEALNRYRGKGQQKVTVEHVTVNHGGQAVIGNVDTTGGTRGAVDNADNLPHVTRRQTQTR
jgi:hypothetical protein